MAVITEIKTNLTRISKAKTDIIAAITAKGGTVASGAKIEDLPACIRAIPTGGGGKAVEFAVKSRVNVVAFTKDGQTPVEVGDDDVVLTVNVGDMLVICVASQNDYFNVKGGSGYKELGFYSFISAARRMYVYWIRVEEAGVLMLS